MAYDKFKDPTQKQYERNGQENKEQLLAWQCSNHSTKLFHTSKTDVVNHTYDNCIKPGQSV